jgi:hypothetical protein
MASYRPRPAVPLSMPCAVASRSRLSCRGMVLPASGHLPRGDAHVYAITAPARPAERLYGACSSIRCVPAPHLSLASGCGGLIAELLNDWSLHRPGAASHIPSATPALAARGIDRVSVGACPLTSEAAGTSAALRPGWASRTLYGPSRVPPGGEIAGRARRREALLCCRYANANLSKRTRCMTRGPAPLSAVASAPARRERDACRDALQRWAAFGPAGSAGATPPAPRNEVMVILEATNLRGVNPLRRE